MVIPRTIPFTIKSGKPKLEPRDWNLEAELLQVQVEYHLLEVQLAQC